MEMRDRLTGIAIGVYDHAEARQSHSEFARELCRDLVQARNDFQVGILNAQQAFEVADRGNQYMHRGLRVDVVKGYYVLVPICDLGGNVAAGDLAEQAVWHGPHLGGRVPARA
jgi:hypothetical protein